MRRDQLAAGRPLLPIEVLTNPAEGEIASSSVASHPHPESALSDMHRSYEIGVVLTGSQDRLFQGLSVPSLPGDVYLCPGWEPHGCRTTSSGTTVLVIFFCPEFLGDEVLHGKSWLSLFAIPPAARPRVTDPQTRARVLQIAAEIAVEGERQTPGWMTALRLGVLSLLFALSRHWTPPRRPRRPPAPTEDLARVSAAIHLVESNPYRRPSLAEGAAACALSVPRFCQVFRRAMGTGYGTFVTRSRLAYAARLLLTTREPIAALATKLGFTDASHLHRAFVGIYGCTPVEYRAQGR